MQIRNVRITHEGDAVALRADCKIRAVGWDSVYFKVDKKYQDYICADANPFAAALLMPAMHEGKDLSVEGTLSAKLYEGLQRIVDSAVHWDRGLKSIKVQAQVLPDTVEAKQVGVFFSGGVDSFYTYLKHKHDGQDAVTHFILVNGYDIALQNKQLWEATVSSVREIAQAEGIELIEVESNIREIIEHIVPWDDSHGGCLAAVGLFLRRGFSKIYISSTYDLKQQHIKRGSNLETDKYWGTETLTFEHDGVEATRVEKVAWQIAKSPLALKYLRVCYRNVREAYNCGECEKCLRTMINLYIAGVLEKAETFPHTINLQKVATLHLGHEHTAAFSRENLAALKEQHLNPELQHALEQSLAHIEDTDDTAIHAFLKKVFYIDAMYLHGTVRSWYAQGKYGQ